MAAVINPLGLAPGSKALAAYATTYNGSLGKTWVQDGVTYRLIKTSAALASCAKQAVLDSGTTTQNWTIATVTSAATHRCAGFLPVGQVDLASGDFALVVISGQTTAICGTATTAGNGLVTAATGRVTDTSGTYAANAIPQYIGKAMQTQTTGNDVIIVVSIP